MPRLIILLLPILVLWTALRSADHGGQEGRRGREARFVTDTARDHRNSFRPGMMEDKGESPLGRQLRSLQGPGEKLEMSQREGAETAGGRARRVWERIDSELISALSPREKRKLKNFISRRVSDDAKEQPWICWGEDVSQSTMAAFHEAEKLTGMAGGGYSLFANQFLGSGRWDRTATNGFNNNEQGSPVVVTWSIVPDGTSTPGTEDEPNASSNFRSWMASIYGGSTTAPAADQLWFKVFEDAFQEMADTCGITLRYEPNDDGVIIRSSNRGILGVRGDIRIAARYLDGESGTLAFAFSPDHGDMIFDSGDSTFQNTAGNSLRLFNTIAHELGHGLGLAHVCPVNQTKLLEPNLSTQFRGPRFDEYQSLQRLYGDASEANEGTVDNDSSTRATSIDLLVGGSKSLSRLSIDDNTDEDYFRFSVLSGQKITVSMTPGEGSYLEGESTVSGCTDGTTFNSATIHNLSLEVIDQDGSTVLASANSGGPGEVESVAALKLPADGDYFIRVNGDTTNAAQLYRLDLLLGERDPGARLAVGEGAILAESGSVKNGRLDPDETIQISFPISNQGNLPTSDLSLQVSGSDNVTIFSAELPKSEIASGETVDLEVVFGGVGVCGDMATLSVVLTDNSGVLVDSEQNFQLGDVEIPTPIDEDFDASSTLPDLWSSEEAGAGEEWISVSSKFDSPIRSAFSGGVGAISQASLVSPAFTVASGGGALSFRHFYRMERSFDGGVLEATRNGGSWFDLVTHPEVQVTGGYNRIIETAYGSPIAGRDAWSGRSSSFETVVVQIPANWGGEEVRFRWRLAHDRSTFEDGWWIDNVLVTLLIEDCEEHRPAFELSLREGKLDENKPTEAVTLTLSSELPLVHPVTVVLEASGSASPADYSGSLQVVFPVGETEYDFELGVISDNLVEGDEDLTLTIQEGDLAFVGGSDPSETLVLTDQRTIRRWQQSFFSGEVDLEGDSDHDGFSELEEYLLGTDPTSVQSQPELSFVPNGPGFLIPVGNLPARPDASMGVEFSEDLKIWNKGDLDLRPEGIFVDPPEGSFFARLTFSLN